MIEFVTLLLGLAAGPQLIELSAGTDVAEVRLLLDGEVVAIDTEPPWEVAFDLGSTLEPHLLEAVSYDAEGNELGRAVQRLNIPRPPAEARITFERNEGGEITAALLTWESAIAVRPRQTRAWLDGEALEVSDFARIAIPQLDLSQFHFLHVELQFSLGVIAQAQAVFGGLYIDESRTELTALPVLVRGKRQTLDVSRMANWFERDGTKLQVSAFDKGGLDLVLVRGPGVGAAVTALEGTFSQGVTSGGVGSPGVSGPESLGNIMNMGGASASERMRQIMALDQGQRLRIMIPRARAQGGRSVAMSAFAMSPEITDERGGMYWALRQDVELPGLAPELRLADATAVAGLQAANGNRRRGVLLVLADAAPADAALADGALADGARDESRHTVREVRDYLGAIQVPLFVWRIGEPAQREWKEWGPGEAVTGFRQLQAAARHLSDALDRQRIVWLEGLHLPNQIEISPSAQLERVVARPPS